MNLERTALREAAEMRLIGLLFERPREGRRAGIRALASEIGDGRLRELAERLLDLDEPTYTSLFGPGGPVSPREAAYLKRADPGQAMADASAFYEAFGYRPRSEDPVDHIAVEAGFVAYLLLKEAYAGACGAAPEVTAAARTRFVESHLSPLGAGIAARLRKVQAPEMLALASALLERTGGTPAPDEEDEEAPVDGEMSCGSCGAAGESGPRA